MLIRRLHEAKVAGATTVTVRGSGEPRRELLHVDDLATACVFLMNHYDEAALINIGTGVDDTVRFIAETIRDVVHPDARLTFDRTKPDGMPRKVLDVTRIHALGWRHAIDLRDGLRRTYDWYRSAPHVRGHDQAPSACPAFAAARQRPPQK
jgi:GDP-L-fucose synthase